MLHIIEREHYPDNMLFENILKGGVVRDQALKYLLIRSSYPSIIKGIIMEGGGDSVHAEKIIEDCIILFDRKVRRFELDRNLPLSQFFTQEAKRLWTEQLMTDKSSRDRVIERIHADRKLERQIGTAIRKQSGKQEDAEDCYQNGIILLNSNMQEGKYRGGAIKGYFYQLCFNLWRNELKKHRPASLETESEQSPATFDDPQHILEHREQSDILRKIFRSLDASCRKIIRLKYFIIDQLSMEEIAKEMGLKNAQNAANALSKCRKKLWELVQQHKVGVLWKNNMKTV